MVRAYGRSTTRRPSPYGRGTEKSGVLRIRSDGSWPWQPWQPYCHIKKIVVEKGVKTGACAAAMFAGMRDCTEFDVLELDVSAAEDMRCMFECCSSMENIAALKKWDVSNVTAMSWMFADCCSLKDVSALAGWDVSKVNNMAHMFGSCASLTDVSPLLEWNTLNVRDTTAMFDGTGVSRDAYYALIPMACPREGTFIGYKKCRGGRIVQLEVPEDAKRSSAYGRKCRCSKAKVLNIWTRHGDETGCALSCFDDDFVYWKGETVEVSNFDDNRFNECSTGIHFFMTLKEAEEYMRNRRARGV